MATWREKPPPIPTIETVQWTGDNLTEVTAWLYANGITSQVYVDPGKGADGAGLLLRRGVDMLTIQAGAYLYIRGPSSTTNPASPVVEVISAELLAQLYEPADVPSTRGTGWADVLPTRSPRLEGHS